MQQDLIVLFWDQLTNNITSLKAYPDAPVLMIEAWDDFTHVKHHKKKIAFLLSAMRHFYSDLSKKRNVMYFTLEDQKSNSSFQSVLSQYITKHKVKNIIATHPSEYRQLKNIKKVSKQQKCNLTLLEDDRFFCEIKEGQDWIQKSNKKHLMENFYRLMRKKTSYLMENNKPIGGKWNYDKENRKPPNDKLQIPNIKGFKPNSETVKVCQFVEKHFKSNFGDIYPFWYGVTRRQALIALNRFIEHALPLFGEYQDAMLEDEAFLYHSVLSQYIHIGLLSPAEVCEKVIECYEQKHISLACAEGFVRQIIGWREYIRAIYWAYMPKYLESNALNYQTKLPQLYWDGKTQLNCLAHSIKQTRIHAYSHHIQRLMITGNFAMLIGVLPEQIHEWYLIVYIDAFEWVELPNTIGMATYADGGLVGTKPYISGGNYINKMSNFCKSCYYDVKLKEGEKACPFNYLYWNFLINHQTKLKNNHRLRMPYNTLSKMIPTKIKKIQKQAKEFIESIT